MDLIRFKEILKHIIYKPIYKSIIHIQIMFKVKSDSLTLYTIVSIYLMFHENQGQSIYVCLFTN